MKIILVFLSLFLLSACFDDGVYTLYRSSPSNENFRIHVATFDASDGNDYNSENCKIAIGLFEKQEGVTVKYWCEKGRFKK
jgi:hypothetical protein